MRVLIPLKCSLPLAIISALLFLLTSLPAQAGCGCDKPPPPPAAVIPHVAFSRMKISLFHDSFVEGQKWKIVFRNGEKESSPRQVKVASRRDLSDTTGQTLTPRLTVSVPPTVPVGPTSIIVSKGAESFTIPDTQFTVIGKPVVVSEKNANFTKVNYTTAVGADGTMYFGLSGLAKICQPMKFKALMEGNPLRFGDHGDITILNSQGFLIETLTCTLTGCTPANHYFPELNIGDTEHSDEIEYWRHSFAQYCLNHRRGGLKEVDPYDRNWHKDGTPHVDYSTLIFAIVGHYDDGSIPALGAKTFNLKMEGDPDDIQDGWEEEKEEELIEPH